MSHDNEDELLHCEGEDNQLLEQNQELEKIFNEDPNATEPSCSTK